MLWIIGYHNSNHSPMPKSPVFFSSTNVAPRPHWGWLFQQVMPKWKQSCANLASQWGTPSGTFGNWFWNGGSCWDVKNSIVHAEAHAHCSEDHAKMFLEKIFASWACRRTVYWDARIIYAPKLASPHHDPHNNRLHDDDNNNDYSTNNNNHYHHCHRRHRHRRHHHHHFNYTLFLLPFWCFSDKHFPRRLRRKACIFGEGPYERRDRLRTIMAGRAGAQDGSTIWDLKMKGSSRSTRGSLGVYWLRQ